MIKAVIFDMDGVLINTEMYFMDMIRRHLDAIGAVYDDTFLYSLVGGSDPIIMKQLDPIVNFTMSGEAFLNQINQEIIDNSLPYDELKMDGVYEVLNYLQDKGYLIGLASSSPRRDIDSMTTALGITSFFHALSSGHEYEESKPNPEIYVDTLRKLGVSKEECIVIEDSNHGIKAAKGAGMYVIGMKDYHFGMDQSEADILVDNLLEVISIIEERSK